MADNAKTVQTAAELEHLLDELGEVESFAPPPEFRARARITDPDVYAAAARDPEAYWAGRDSIRRRGRRGGAGTSC